MRKPTLLTLESVFKVPKEVLVETEGYLRQHGARGQEGMVFWGGVSLGSRAEVRRAIHPTQSCSAVSVDVDTEAVQKMYRILESRGEILLAQVHSHPGGAFHSTRDDDFPATFLVGYLSIVVPDFCRRGFGPLEDCGAWVHTGLGHWRELSAPERIRKIVIVTDENR